VALGQGTRHPNVLAYIDSWEQDEALYIQTELCEFGNLAHFLWEYGRAFPWLNEARVWKIIADLSNVRPKDFSLLPLIGPWLSLSVMPRTVGGETSLGALEPS
jgi:hypothetical protein